MSNDDLVKLIPKHQQIEINIFEDFIYPAGALSMKIEEHALMYYYLYARKNYEEFVKDNPVVYEGELDPTTNFRQLFVSVSKMYCVDPTAMSKCWKIIDQQCLMSGFPLLPREERYRFDSVITLDTKI